MWMVLRVCWNGCSVGMHVTSRGVGCRLLWLLGRRSIRKSNQMQLDQWSNISKFKKVFNTYRGSLNDVHISSKWYFLMFGQWLLNLFDDLTFRLVERDSDPVPRGELRLADKLYGARLAGAVGEEHNDGLPHQDPRRHQSLTQSMQVRTDAERTHTHCVFSPPVGHS